MHACTWWVKGVSLTLFNYEKAGNLLGSLVPALSLLQKALSGKGCGRGPAGI